MTKPDQSIWSGVPPMSPVRVLVDWSYSVHPVLATSQVPTHDTLEPPIQAPRILLDYTRAMELRKEINDTTGGGQL